MIYLHKILPLLVSPLLLLLTVVIIGLLTSSKKIGLLGVVLLLIFSLPIVADRLVSFLERDYKPLAADGQVDGDAIVVLSGMVRLVKFDGDNQKYEWSEASDRVFAGIELFKNKRAPALIFTRGQLPWSMGYPEGEYLQKVAVKLGVTQQHIFLTEDVENTEQEAWAVKKLIGKSNPKIILVTSAFHMPRAEQLFRVAGIDVIPFPVDFRSGPSKITIMQFIPSAEGLRNVSFFVQEMIGRTYYAMKY